MYRGKQSLIENYKKPPGGDGIDVYLIKEIDKKQWKSQGIMTH